MITPVVDAENWTTPQEIHTPRFQTACGNVSVARYEDNHHTPILISIGAGECVALMVHVTNADAIAIRDALNKVIVEPEDDDDGDEDYNDDGSRDAYE